MVFNNKREVRLMSNSDFIDIPLKTSDIAETLKMPESTVRKYCQLLEDKGYEFKKNELGHRIYDKHDQESIRQMSVVRQKHKVGIETAAVMVAARFKRPTQDVSAVNSVIPTGEEKYWQQEIGSVSEQIQKVERQLSSVMTQEQGKAIFESLQQIAVTSENMRQEYKEMAYNYALMKEKLDQVEKFMDTIKKQEETVLKKLDEKDAIHEKQLAQQREEILDAIGERLADPIERRTVELSNSMNRMMEERRLEVAAEKEQAEQEKKKSFFKKLFG